MQKITVKSVETKQGKTSGKPFYILTDDKGASYSSFDESVCQLQPGAVIDGEVEISGKYNNLKAWHRSPPAPMATVPQPPSAGATPDYAQIQRRSIEEQTAVKSIVELAVAGVIPVGHIALRAALAWLTKRVEPEYHLNQNDYSALEPIKKVQPIVESPMPPEQSSSTVMTETPALITEAQLAIIKELCKTVPLSKTALDIGIKNLALPNINKLPAAKADELITALKAKAAKGGI